MLCPKLWLLHPKHWSLMLGLVCGIFAQPVQAQIVNESSPLQKPTIAAIKRSASIHTSGESRSIANAQTVASSVATLSTVPQLNLAQNTPVLLPQQDVFPPDSDLPESTVPSPLEQELLDVPETPEAPEAPALLEGQLFIIAEITFENRNVFTVEELLNSRLTTYGDCGREGPCPTLRDILTKTLSAPAIYQVAADVAAFYAAEGYQTSGAVIELDGTPEATILRIQLIEDQLEDIIISESPLQAYVQNRLGVAEEEPLNVSQLQDKLRLLQIDPLVDRVAASLTAGSTPGNSILSVEIEEAPVYSIPLGFNNSRSPSVGTDQQQITLKKTHIFGIGDSLSLGYTRSAGSDAISSGYTAILNPNNDTLSFNVNYTENRIIEAPFDRIDILSDSASYNLSYRRPLYRSVSSGADTSDPDNPDARNLPTYQEFALTLGAQLRDSNSSLSNIPFQFADIADGSGNTRSFVLQFGQEWTRQNALQAFSLRSNFSLGIDAFGATITPDDFPLEVADGRFFSWRGQGQWVRLMDGRDPNFLFVLRGDVQLSDDPLLSSEKFSLGGARTVRGYRQDSLVTDNGALISAEFLLPIFNDKEYGTVFQIIPFIDYGVGWNNAGNAPPQSVRSSAGIGLQLTQGNQNPFRIRLDIGFPLVDVESSSSTWQEDGLHFSIQYNPSF